MKPNTQSGLSTLQIIIILTAVAVIFGLIATLSSSNDQVSVTQDTADTAQDQAPLENLAQNIAENETQVVTQATNERNDMIEAEMAVDTMMDEADDMAATSEMMDDTAPASAGTFEAYSPEKLALANNGTVVLFFHADWCPSCRGLENDINDNLGEIPANTHILKLDYDTETELKQQYGVIRQHTLVIVDANGTELRKLTGLTNTLDQVVSQL